MLSQTLCCLILGIMGLSAGALGQNTMRPLAFAWTFNMSPEPQNVPCNSVVNLSWSSGFHDVATVPGGKWVQRTGTDRSSNPAFHNSVLAEVQCCQVLTLRFMPSAQCAYIIRSSTCNALPAPADACVFSRSQELAPRGSTGNVSFSLVTPGTYSFVCTGSSWCAFYPHGQKSTSMAMSPV